MHRDHSSGTVGRVPVVSLEQDAKYRRDGDRFVEVCRACDLERAGDHCRCGATFEKAKRSFFALSWDPTTLRPELPPVCPHCEGPADRLRSITMRLPTERRRFVRMTIELPSCPRMLPPFAAYLLLLTSVFFAAVFGLASASGNGIAAYVPLALALAGVSASWRAYGWLRFASFDHRSIRLRVRRPGYARLLAERNGGRVL